MIQVEHLTKRYGNNIAVRDLSFTLEPGRIYGFLGPNGAGKSTTMNILTGCLAASEGTVKINGWDIFEQPQQAKACVGYLPEQPPLYFDMTPLEYLTFVGKAKGLRGEALRSQVASVMERTGTVDVQNRLIKNLSKGYKQRVGIAQAILGAPEMIILDEPTVGLDPKQMVGIRSLIKSLAKEHTVILSSHILSEVSAVCDYVLILSHGTLVASDTPENLTRMAEDQNALLLTLRGGEKQVRELLAANGISDAVCTPSEDTNAVDVVVPHDTSEELRERIFRAAASASLPLLRMERRCVTLEDIFLSLTKEEDAEEEEEEGPEETPAEREALSAILGGVRRSRAESEQEDDAEDDAEDAIDDDNPPEEEAEENSEMENELISRILSKREADRKEYGAEDRKEDTL